VLPVLPLATLSVLSPLLLWFEKQDGTGNEFATTPSMCWQT
jgi:hypothetical protein